MVSRHPIALLSIALWVAAVVASCSERNAPAVPDTRTNQAEMVLVRNITDSLALVRHSSGRCFLASKSGGGHDPYTWIYSQVDREMCA